MIERRCGRIINMSSQAGFIALPGEAIYCMTKAGIAHLTKCLAVEWGKYNINVNAVAPTFIETPGTDEAWPIPTSRRRRRAHRRAPPHRRTDGGRRRGGLPRLAGRIDDNRPTLMIEAAGQPGRRMGGGVTVIVPVWNRRDLLERLLYGLRAQTYSIAEILVIDDGSHDDSALLAERLGADSYRMGSHGGFAKAVNRGIQESATELVAIVNNDVDLAPDWLETLAGALEPAFGFATGRILQAAAPDRIDATHDALCRGGTAWRAGTRPTGWAGVSLKMPDLVRAFHGRSVSRHPLRTDRNAR